jgi:hypothetical protein
VATHSLPAHPYYFLLFGGFVVAGSSVVGAPPSGQPVVAVGGNVPYVGCSGGNVVPVTGVPRLML